MTNDELKILSRGCTIAVQRENWTVEVWNDSKPVFRDYLPTGRHLTKDELNKYIIYVRELLRMRGSDKEDAKGKLK